MKTLRMIGMALFAVLMCVNFASCSSEEVVPEEPKPLTTLEQINNATSLNDFAKMNIAEFSDEELMAFMNKRAELKAKAEEGDTTESISPSGRK
jgi:hypothetical protein